MYFKALGLPWIPVTFELICDAEPILLISHLDLGILTSTAKDEVTYDSHGGGVHLVARFLRGVIRR